MLRDSRLDRRAIEAAECALPLLKGLRIDGSYKVLVAIVVTLAWPMLSRGGNAVLLKHLELNQCVALDRIDVTAEAARGDNGAAERGIDVEYRREGPVDAGGSPLLAMMRLISAVASMSSTAARPRGFSTWVPNGRLMRLPSRSPEISGGTGEALVRSAIFLHSGSGSEKPR